MEQYTFPTLYTLSSAGKLHEWTMEVDGDGYRTHHGYVGGKIQTTEWFRATPKNVGKKNATTGHTQAMAEAKSTYDKKVERGGVTDPALAKYEMPFIEPMTAKKWKEVKENPKRLAKLGIFTDGKPVFTQPKLDGKRTAIVQGCATSRGGKEWTMVDHLHEVLAPVFEKYPNLMVDGELYNHAYAKDFNTISSLIRNTPSSPEHKEKARELVKLYWYDIQVEDQPHLTFLERYQLMITICQEFPHLETSGHVVVVDTKMVTSIEEVGDHYEAWLDADYEGSMIRLDAPYENDRTWSLLKFKPLEDEEFEIDEVCEGSGNKTGMAAWVWFKNHRVPGQRFKTNVKGGNKFAAELLKRKAELDGGGTWGTVEYLNLTPENDTNGGLKPRCGFLTRLRKGPSQD